MINNYINSDKINLIISIITNLGIIMANYLKKIISLYLCHILKIDQSNKNNIKKILKNSLYQKINDQ